jgi:hypothetical protein
MTTRHAARIAYTADLLEAARARDPLGYLVGEIEAYCTNAACNVRIITITIKEQRGPTPPALSCPSCRRPAKLHHVLTLAEAEAQRAEDARASVNIQLYEQLTGSLSIPAGLFLDTRLPTVERLQALERGDW